MRVGGGARVGCCHRSHKSPQLEFWHGRGYTYVLPVTQSACVKVSGLVSSAKAHAQRSGPTQNAMVSTGQLASVMMR